MAIEPTLNTVFKRVDQHMPPARAPQPAAPAQASAPPSPGAPPEAHVDPPARPVGPAHPVEPEVSPEEPQHESAAGLPLRYPFHLRGQMPGAPTASDFVDWLVSSGNPLPLIASFLEDASETVRARARDRLRQVEEETDQLQSLLGTKPARKRPAGAIPPAGDAPTAVAAERRVTTPDQRQQEEDRVLEYLRFGQLDRVTSRRVAESMGYSYSQAGGILQRLQAKGLVAVHGRGIGALWHVVQGKALAAGASDVAAAGQGEPT